MILCCRRQECKGTLSTACFTDRSPKRRCWVLDSKVCHVLDPDVVEVQIVLRYDRLKSKMKICPGSVQMFDD